MAETKNDSNKIEKMINDLVERAKKASKEYRKLNQEQVDNVVKAMSMAGLETSYGTCKTCSRGNWKRYI